MPAATGVRRREVQSRLLELDEILDGLFEVFAVGDRHAELGPNPPRSYQILMTAKQPDAHLVSIAAGRLCLTVHQFLS
jgi:hypothetical protein